MFTRRLMPAALAAALALAAPFVPAHDTVVMPEAGHAGHDMSSHEGHDMSAQAGEADHSAHLAVASSAGGRENDVRVTLHDDLLLTHHGDRVRFVSDVLGEKLVALTVAYTTCTTVCPVTSVIFSQVQQALGERMEKEVRLVSITVDPTTDTPARLKRYASNHGVHDGWLWLTGDKQDVDHVLTGLGAYTPEYEEHPIMFLIGDPATGKWSRLFGFPTPDAIVAELDALAAARMHLRHQTASGETQQ